MLKSIYALIGVMVIIFILSSLPDALHDKNGRISFTPSSSWDSMTTYIAGIANGESFQYIQGKNRVRNFIEDIGKFFITSFLYLFISAICIVLISLMMSIWQALSKREWVKDIVGFCGFMPDFVLILFLQMGVVFLYKTTGTSVAMVASKSFAEPAIFLPLVTLTIIPAIYLIRTLSEKTYDVLTEEYILTAKSKGLKKMTIILQHVIRNVLPYLKADLHGMMAIMMGNLFIVEYLFNIPGVTKLIFSEADYQFNLTVNGLLTLVLIYILLYWGIRAFVYGLERIFAYG